MRPKTDNFERDDEHLGELTTLSHGKENRLKLGPVTDKQNRRGRTQNITDAMDNTPTTDHRAANSNRERK